MIRLQASVCRASRKGQILTSLRARVQQTITNANTNATTKTTTTTNSLKRFKSTNSNTGTKSPTTTTSRAPEIKIDPAAGNTVLHEKAARAAELHAELNELLDAQAKRRAEEANRPFGAGFFDFVKKSKSEMINIFAAFTCVLLAYQISNIRKGARKLLDEADEKEIRIEKLKGMLRLISNEEFSDKVVSSYEKRLENSKLLEMEKNGKKWLFGRGSRSSSTNGQSIEENESTSTGSESGSSNNNNLLKSVLENELRKTIGDIALTEDELEDKKLVTLQTELGFIETQQKQQDSSSSLGGLENVFADVQKEENDLNLNYDDSDKKVVKRKGFI
jgi:hypothetical protein